MKYKSKFSANQKHFHTSYTMKIAEGESFTDVKGLTPGVFVFIPFSDTRFFEPIKTRTFQVEVSEDQMHCFEAYVLQHDDRWTVTDITEDKYLTALKRSGDVDLQVVEALQNTLYLERIVTAYQIIKEREKDKLRVVKGLKDYTNACAASIKGLKNAKDIVYAWWDL